MSVVQIEQDFALCTQDFPNLICRPIGAQFMREGTIALFEFVSTEEGVRVSMERHYQLTSPDLLTAAELAGYRLGASTQ